MKYFAYGSNMDYTRMHLRKVRFSHATAVKVIGYRLNFDKKAKAGNFGYANIVKCADHHVTEGILYEINDDDLSILDKFEGYPLHYNREQVLTIDKAGKKIYATTYVANANRTTEGLKPTREYLNHLLKAKEYLSDQYYHFLEAIETID